MDELQMVRDLFAEPAPPRPEVTAAARARLAPRYARSRVQRKVNIIAPLGAAAAVTAVAVTIASLPHGPVPGSQVTSGPPQAGQLTSGTYWVQPGVVGNYLRVGQGSDQYVVLDKVGVHDWQAQPPRQPSPVIAQPLSVEPASAADEEAWRAAGSPAVWPDTGQDDSLASPQGFTDGFAGPLTAGVGKPTAGEIQYGSGGFYVFGHWRSARQLLTLPAKPAALKQLLDALYRSEGGGYDSFAGYVLSQLPALMTLPVTVQFRSALERMLAGLPGVHELGTVSDVAGGRGVAFAVDGRYSSCGNDISLTSGSGTRPTFTSCGVQQILIVNPATWLPVAAELRYTSLPPGQSWSAPDGLFSYELFSTGYWTNQNPPAR
jgi:hypothetical protein